jgi:hypothetical protein
VYLIDVTLKHPKAADSATSLTYPSKGRTLGPTLGSKFGRCSIVRILTERL